MTFLQCHPAVVSTNSRFTPSAVALAATVGCALIDGDQIPELIHGRIRL
jgi:hypothetical protein